MNIYDSMRSAPLRRTPDKLLGGVCAGLAHRWGIAPALVRLLAVLLFFVAGLGLLLYGLAWLFIPAYETEDVLAERALRDPDAGVATAIAMTLIGFISVVGAGLTYFDRMTTYWWDSLVLIVMIGIGLTALFLIGRWALRRRNANANDRTEVNATAADTNATPSEPVRPRPKKQRVSTPAISGRSARFVVALAIAGAALPLIFEDGVLSRILMSLSLGLALLALGVFIAGVRGLRATWLTALTWLVGIPASLALAVSLVLPARFLTAEDLQLWSLSGTESQPSLLYYASNHRPSSSFAEVLPQKVDTFILATGSSNTPEDVPVIYRIKRSPDSFGHASVSLVNIRSWMVIQDGTPTLTRPAEPDDPVFGDGFMYAGQTFYMEPGETLELHTPAALEQPQEAQIVEIDFYYGEFDVFGQAPNNMTTEQWLSSSPNATEDGASEGEDGGSSRAIPEIDSTHPTSDTSTTPSN
ncbi:phage shock protein PspC (stress-responsive transcriptional regulator) [Trueperella bonasi]|uniref:Phage shock protein PspC (Stress-responsive transcriptional regulator) n=1 Tax=Trueperella bonasi TaxID=312286 RepID=A0ABT9NIW6_9ACTO|nr:PspC domain-containing protein [Trueperella bonasi]MDP9807147.1 phage shock protein PspC (stress-responsive transcriptional regulator) [Trueperella bonasi]